MKKEMEDLNDLILILAVSYIAAFLVFSLIVFVLFIICVFPNLLEFLKDVWTIVWQ